MASTWKIRLTFVYLSVLFVLANAQSKQISTETVVLNVTAVSETNQTKYSVQINLNIGLLDNETFINGAPLKPSGVTRMTCPALLYGSNVSSSNLADGLVSSELRLMVNQSYVQSEAGEQLLLLVLSQEIIQLADEKVQQPDACEVEILWNQSSEEITQVTNIYPSSRSKLYAIPRESDVLVTNASIRNTVEDQVLNTTSHYLLKHAETTQEEIAAPGKLPETPLRMDPETLYESREEEERTSDSLLLGSPLSGSMSSYSVACQWVKGLRDKLRRFWSDSIPLFFLIMWVVVVGVAGSAVIIKILDLLFPSCEHGGFFHLNPETLMPDDEKQSLIDNMEGETTEKSILIEK
ncbi:glycoprotein integral membrane protein 1-like isoform X2 [Sinocyclocheilus rhinocerous]|uniref:glycoprotein integral membrane protein 1-like isoform X2 n=1 Tax=Sinocyclocheilus rhinocerous TaxID=307959 RepID=UPI0007B8AB11|nr:PREDICTED: glycoprotein integral membrane protein 1-like isoform X2 [Sinocyclocheilus rhinocerous]